MRVLLIDSSAILNDCFHGYPPRPSFLPSGHAVDTAALFGYLSRVRSLEKFFEFDQIVHALDPEGGSHHRLRIFPDYKANRSANNPIFSAQKLLLPEVLAAFGHRVVCERGLESDDVLATLATKHAARGDQVLIITPDKDLLQLVQDGAIGVARRIERTDGLDGKTYDVYDEQRVVEKLGVHPKQVADYLALVGDVGDNIPGVKNVGPKTAAGWLTQHGDLTTILTQSSTLTGRGAKDLQATVEKLPLYRQLTMVLRDLDGIEPQDTDLPIERDTARVVRAWLNVPPEWPDRLHNSWKPSAAGSDPVPASGKAVDPTPLTNTPIEAEVPTGAPPAQVSRRRLTGSFAM